ncbi:hypothetical protein ROZALSC1DRAFT_29193, partial [Rozella allomycis CSF55]
RSMQGQDCLEDKGIKAAGEYIWDTVSSRDLVKYKDISREIFNILRDRPLTTKLLGDGYLSVRDALYAILFRLKQRMINRKNALLRKAGANFALPDNNNPAHEGLNAIDRDLAEIEKSIENCEKLFEGCQVAVHDIEDSSSSMEESLNTSECSFTDAFYHTQHDLIKEYEDLDNKLD